MIFPSLCRLQRYRHSPLALAFYMCKHWRKRVLILSDISNPGLALQCSLPHTRLSELELLATWECFWQGAFLGG